MTASCRHCVRYATSTVLTERVMTLYYYLPVHRLLPLIPLLFASLTDVNTRHSSSLVRVTQSGRRRLQSSQAGQVKSQDSVCCYGPLFSFLFFLRSSVVGGVACVTVFNSSATWVATFRLEGYILLVIFVFP